MKAIGAVLKYCRRAAGYIFRQIQRKAEGVSVTRKKNRIFKDIERQLAMVDWSLKTVGRPSPRVAGILGVIDSRSGADKALLAALRDGCERVVIYAAIADGAWYFRNIEPIIKSNPEKIQYAGSVKPKKAIYGALSDIYDFSRSAVSRTIRAECKLTGSNFMTTSVKTFQGDFYKILQLLESGTPFAFNRFSDGELFILQNKELILEDNRIKVGEKIMQGGYNKEDHKHFDPAEHGFFRDRLIDAFRFRKAGYFKGLSCACCVGEADFRWQLDFHGDYDENLTWANLIVNGNYIRFLNEMLPVFNRYRTVLVCNERARVSTLPFVVKDFRVGYNALVNDYGLIKDIMRWIENEKIKGYLFLFAASTFSKLAIHQLYEFNGENTYMDIGTTLNPFIGMAVDRGYLKAFWCDGKSKDLFKTCIWK